MISNYEFIKSQSFEVAWAIFRCAELFSQSDLRKKLEAAAVELTAEYDAIGDDMESEFPRIEKLVALVRLAESVGQIASVNANVLYRELDNLAKAIRLEVIDRREKKNITASLEHMFTNSAYGNNLQSTTNNQQQNAEYGVMGNGKGEDVFPSGMTQRNVVIPAEAGIQNFASVIPAEAGIQSAHDSQVRQSSFDDKATQFGPSTGSGQDDRIESQFGNIESLLSAAMQSSQPMSGGVDSASSLQVDSALRKAQDEASSLQVDSAKNHLSDTLSTFLQAPAVTPIRQQAGRDLQSEFGKTESSNTQSAASLGMTTTAPVRPIGVATPQTGSWQHVILQKVKDLNQTTTKELTASFPEISERTIRFYLQKLVDNGLIDRIGSTGPGAAYRAK